MDHLQPGVGERWRDVCICLHPQKTYEMALHTGSDGCILRTFTNQVGTLDWITLVIDILLLSVLVAPHKEYF
jgi:hypothetical protein